MNVSLHDDRRSLCRKLDDLSLLFLVQEEEMHYLLLLQRRDHCPRQ
jgi:hypothetical protein